MNKVRKKYIGFTVIILLLILLFVFFNRFIFSRRRGEYIAVDDSDKYIYQIDSIYLENEKFNILGWFIPLQKVNNISQENFENERYNLILYDLNNESLAENEESFERKKGIDFSMQYVDNNYVNEYFKCEYDYSHSGFIASVPQNKIDLENGCYRVIFKPDDIGDYGIESSIYLCNGEIMYVNPKDYHVIEIEGKDLKDILDNGICLVYNSDYNISIFQVEHKLYWVIDKEYKYFDPDGNTYFQYQLETTQFDKLPQDRKNNGWFWSNIGDIFESHEITNMMDCGRYRVAMREIPDEYSITYIITGFYDEYWIWKECFRQIYSILFE